MKKCSLCVVVIFLLIACAHAQNKTDEAAVRAIPQAFVAAWAKHDGHELAKIMSENVDFVNVGADWLHGRPDFELYHTRLLSGRFKQSSLTLLDTAISFLRPDLAVLHWTWRITGDGHEDPATHEPQGHVYDDR
ncbi:SgcJ/EcaC family oxidoreductase [Terracidiphilus gabretensis]|uniref:SgcJ/EcaC family oxidoreductase n=1 Tax=Terracidiphilus gabretensis TaxID=1577687 RepID=UPI00071B6206|nr:SgcJ/EcaC family oxidoreductase [Terracidiphilus gabretensis]